MRHAVSYHGQVQGMIQVVLGLVLGGSTVVVGKSLTGSLPVFLLSFCTLLTACLVLLPMAVARRKEIAALGPRAWGSLAMQALFGMVLFRVFTLYGLRYTGAVEAGVIMGTTPAVITVLAMIILKERPTRGGMAGVGCAVCGMVALNLAGGQGAGPGVAGEGGGGSGNLWGGLLIFFAVAGEALFTILRKQVAHRISAGTNTVCLVFISLVLLSPFAARDLMALRILPGPEVLAGIGYYGVFGTVIAYLLWSRGVGKISGEAAGIAAAAMPASSVLLAALFLGEPVTPTQIVGCVMVMSGIACGVLLNKNGKCELSS